MTTPFTPQNPYEPGSIGDYHYQTVKVQAEDAGCWNAAAYPFLLSHIDALVMLQSTRENQAANGTITESQYLTLCLRCRTVANRSWVHALQLGKPVANRPKRVTHEVKDNVVTLHTPERGIRLA